MKELLKIIWFKVTDLTLFLDRLLFKKTNKSKNLENTSATDYKSVDERIFDGYDGLVDFEWLGITKNPAYWR